MLEQVQTGFIEDWMWKRIVQRMYEPTDVAILEQKFTDAVAARGSPDSSSSQALAEMRKLTREEKLLLLNNKDERRLLFSEF